MEAISENSCLNDDMSIELFNNRVSRQANINAVLDAGETTESKKANLLHDYSSKK